MDPTMAGRGSGRSRPCSSTSTASLRFLRRHSKCPRRATHSPATRNCSLWFGSLRSWVGISNLLETEESLSWHGIPCGDLFAALRRTTAAPAIWAIYHDEIVAWLLRNNLQESVLADACLMLERVCSRIRATVWVRKKDSAVTVRIFERMLSQSDLLKLRRESPTVYDELMRRGSVGVSISRAESRLEE